jgi:hypothetical protein
MPGGRFPEQRQALLHEPCVPSRSILLDERTEMARGIESCRDVRRMEAHQRRQGARLGHGGARRLQEERRQANGLVADLQANGGFLPRDMRFSIAARPVRNASAISPAPKPQRMLSTSATWASSDKRGWQHENIIRSCSSRIVDAANASARAPVCPSIAAALRPPCGTDTQIGS